MRARRSRREAEASAQSAQVAGRMSAIDRVYASAWTLGPHRLSEGVLVEASIIARLLRWRLLTLDASVVLLPASAPAAEPGARTPQLDAPAGETGRRRRLSEAVTTIEQAEQELVRARLTAVPSDPP